MPIKLFLNIFTAFSLIVISATIGALVYRDSQNIELAIAFCAIASVISFPFIRAFFLSNRENVKCYCDNLESRYLISLIFGDRFLLLEKMEFKMKEISVHELNLISGGSLADAANAAQVGAAVGGAMGVVYSEPRVDPQDHPEHAEGRRKMAGWDDDERMRVLGITPL